jgi:ABC-type multidrug transport system fused ATPase/permease subunit
MYARLGYAILKPCWMMYSVATAIGIIASYVGASYPSYLRTMMTQYDPLTHLAPLLSFSLIAGACSALRGLLFTQLHQRMYRHFSAAIFDRIRSATMETWEVEWKESELTNTIISDIHEVILTIGLFWNVTMRTLTTLLCVSLQWYQLSPSLFFHGIAAGVFHMTLFHIVQPYYQQLNEESAQKKRDIEANMNEYVQKHSSILLYGWQPVYEETHERRIEEYRRSIRTESYSYAGLLLTSQMLPGWGETYLVLYMLQQGHPISFLTEVIAYYQLVNSALQACKDQWIATWKKRKAMNTLWNLLQKPVQPTPSHLSITQGTIEWDQITFRYPTSSVPIFSSFSLTIQPGEHCVLSAKSGRGKTTLLSLLMGLYPVDSGTIRIGPHDVRNLHPTQIRSLISIVPQDPWYDPQRTVRENLLMGLTDQPLPHDLLKRVQLEALPLDEKMANVSGGQKQRLALARALLRHTPIVILDEPTAALDEETERAMISLLLEHMKDKTVIWITHHAERLPMGFRTITL